MKLTSTLRLGTGSFGVVYRACVTSQNCSEADRQYTHCLSTHRRNQADRPRGLGRRHHRDSAGATWPLVRALLTSPQEISHLAQVRHSIRRPTDAAVRLALGHTLSWLVRQGSQALDRCAERSSSPLNSSVMEYLAGGSCLDLVRRRIPVARPDLCSSSPDPFQNRTSLSSAASCYSASTTCTRRVRFIATSKVRQRRRFCSASCFGAALTSCLFPYSCQRPSLR